MSFCFSVSFSFKIMNYIVYQCKTIKIHNLIRLRKFFLFPNFGSKEFEDSTLLPQSRNSKLDFFFFLMSEGRKVDEFLIEWHSELQEKNFCFLMLYEILPSIHFQIIIQLLCFIFPSQQQVVIQNKNIYKTLLFLMCSKRFPSLLSDCKSFSIY